MKAKTKVAKIKFHNFKTQIPPLLDKHGLSIFHKVKTKFWSVNPKCQEGVDAHCWGGKVWNKVLSKSDLKTNHLWKGNVFQRSMARWS